MKAPFTKEPFPSTDRMRGVHSLLFLADEADAGHHRYSISHRIKSLTSTPAELVSRLRPRLVSECRQRICSPTLSIALTMCTKRGSCPTSQVFAGTRPTVRRRNRRPSRIVRTPAAALELQTVTVVEWTVKTGPVNESQAPIEQFVKTEPDYGSS